MSIFQNVLQIPTQNEPIFPWIAFGISIVTGISVAISLMINWKARKEETKIRYIQLLRDFDRDLFGEEEFNIKTKDDAENYAIRLLLTLSRIVYLHQKKKVQDDVVDYFRNYFAYGLTIKIWLNKIYPEIGIEDRKKFANFEQWCKQHSIEPAPENDLPTTLKNYERLSAKE